MTTTWTATPQRTPRPRLDPNLYDHALTAEQEVWADCLALAEALHERLRQLEEAPPPELAYDDVQGLRWMAGELLDRLEAAADYSLAVAAERRGAAVARCG